MKYTKPLEALRNRSAVKRLSALRASRISRSREHELHTNKSQLFASVTATLALVISIWQGYSTKIHNELSVLPVLTAQSKIKGLESDNGIFLSNEGLGPGIIKNMSIKLGNENFDLTKQGWESFLKKIGRDAQCFRTNKLNDNSKISASETIALFEIPPRSSPLCFYALRSILVNQDIKITIDYESIYGNKMTHNSSLSLKDEDVYLLNTLGIF